MYARQYSKQHHNNKDVRMTVKKYQVPAQLTLQHILHTSIKQIQFSQKVDR